MLSQSLLTGVTPKEFATQTEARSQSSTVLLRLVVNLLRFWASSCVYITLLDGSDCSWNRHICLQSTHGA